jgi:hypothetical protein
MSNARPTLPLTGGCSCGAIRYEITAFPLLLYTCNCTDCQSASGSAFGLSMPVPSKAFRIVQGEPKPWRRKSPLGVNVTGWFCATCGTRLYGEREGRPDSVNVRAGTLDDTAWLTPIAHMFTRSAQGWLVPPEGVECFDTAPKDFVALAEKWRAMWPEFFSAKQ